MVGSLVGGITAGALLTLVQVTEDEAWSSAALEGVGFGLILWVVLTVVLLRSSHR